jgi:hypothetical protein
VEVISRQTQLFGQNQNICKSPIKQIDFIRFKGLICGRPDPTMVNLTENAAKVIKRQLTAIEGLRVDFVEAFVGGGFRHDNPRVVRSCGCSVSFKAAPEAGINAEKVLFFIVKFPPGS